LAQLRNSTAGSATARGNDMYRHTPVEQRGLVP